MQDAIREAEGIEALLAILTQSVQQHREMQRPSGSISSTEGAAARSVLAQGGLGSRQGDRPNRGGLHAPAAAHAAGAIMNLQLNAKNKVALEQVGSSDCALLCSHVPGKHGHQRVPARWGLSRGEPPPGGPQLAGCLHHTHLCMGQCQQREAG